jgi:hypothetical protein
MQPLSNKKRRWHFYIFVLLFLVMLPMIVLYVQGYRLGSNLALVKVGGIYIGGVDSDVEVFFNDVLQKDIKKLKSGFFIDDLYPAKYFISIKKEGYTSWNKDVVVRGAKVSEIYPLIIPTELYAHEIPAQVEESRGFFGSNASTTLVTNDIFVDTLKLFSKETGLESVTRRAVTLWHDGNNVYFVWKVKDSSATPVFCGVYDCTATSTAFTALEKINRVDFLPGRNDVLLVALPSGLYSVEMDNKPPQHSVQIYSGKNADFRIEDGEILYVKDGQKLFQVDI